MRTLIVYFSKTGNTKKYAEDMAQALKCDVLPIKKFKRRLIDQYDTIVFGSRVMGSQIQKINDFLMFYDDMKEKNIIVFAVGMSIPTKETRANLISANILDLYHLRFYQLRGSFEFEKLSFVEKFLMNRNFQMIANDPNATVDQRAVLALKDTPIIVYDQPGVDKIISVIRKIDTVVEVQA